MPATALIFLPSSSGNATTLPNATTSPTSAIISHISRTHNPKSLGQYSLEHRLMVDTSSLLPGHTAPRRHTHFLTLPSYLPRTTFVGTTTISIEDRNERPNGSTNGSPDQPKPSSPDVTLMKIPAQPDTLFPLLMQKMSPLWVPRQAHRVEGGVWFEIGDWKARIGELKVTGGLGQGRIRGCVCEVEFPGGDEWDGGEEETDGVVRAFFEVLLHGSGVDLDTIKIIGSFVGKEDTLVRQYMSLLRFGS